MKIASLLYHDVLDSNNTDSGFDGAIARRYKLTYNRFVESLNGLQKAHPFRPITVFEIDDFLADYDRGFLPFLLTFDDGGKSAVRIASELDKRGWRGHFFITADRIGTKGFVSKSDIVALYKSGHIVGSHSFSHPNAFGALPFDKQLDEWMKSRNVLEDILGASVVCASVPGGVFNNDVARSASISGFEFLFTSEPALGVKTIEQCKVFGRCQIKDNTPISEIVGYSLGSSFFVGKQFVLWNGKKVLKKFSYPLYRRISEVVNKNRG